MGLRLAMRRLTGGLWREPDFLRLFASDSIFNLSNGITSLALPLTAVATLAATPLEMGVLGAARNAPFIVFGLLAGVLVDRMRRRPVLVAGSVLEAVVLASVPVAAVAGLLRIEQLYAVAFVTGTVGVVGTVAAQAFLPRLVGRERLVEGNAKLRASGSLTDVAGPSLGGALVQLLTAPIAIAVDAVARLASALVIASIRTPEPPPAARVEGRRIWHDVAEGIRYIVDDRLLRAIALTGATHNVFSNGMLVALYVLYANRTLGIDPITLGLVFAAGAPGSLLGALVARRYAARAGLVPSLAHMQLLTGAARGLVPLAAVVPNPALALALGELLLGIARSVFNINQLSLRQAMTPDAMQGRMNASIRFLMWAVVPFGALLGGALAERIGMVETLALAAAGTTVSALWLATARVNGR